MRPFPDPHTSVEPRRRELYADSTGKSRADGPYSGKLISCVRSSHHNPAFRRQLRFMDCRARPGIFEFANVCDFRHVSLISIWDLAGFMYMLIVRHCPNCGITSARTGQGGCDCVRARIAIWLGAPKMAIPPSCISEIPSASSSNFFPRRWRCPWP